LQSARQSIAAPAEKPHEQALQAVMRSLASRMAAQWSVAAQAALHFFFNAAPDCVEQQIRCLLA
jgi:hypothetical protein